LANWGIAGAGFLDVNKDPEFISGPMTTGKFVFLLIIAVFRFFISLLLRYFFLVNVTNGIDEIT